MKLDWHIDQLNRAATQFKGAKEALDFLVERTGKDFPEFAMQSHAQQHSDDIAVDHFAAAMKAKLAKKREQGRGGWETAKPEYLSKLLLDHIAKGDPIDVANFCMMLCSMESKILIEANNPMDGKYWFALCGELYSHIADIKTELKNLKHKSPPQKTCTTCKGSGYGQPSTDSFLCPSCNGDGYSPAPEGGE